VQGKSGAFCGSATSPEGALHGQTSQGLGWAGGGDEIPGEARVRQVLAHALLDGRTSPSHSDPRKFGATPFRWIVLGLDVECC